MSFLGDLSEIIFDAFGELDLFADAVLRPVTGRVSDGRGGYTETFGTVDCKALIDDYSDYRRIAMGIPATDTKIVVLARSISGGIVPMPGARISIVGKDWLIVAVTRDPAGATYELQSRGAGLSNVLDVRGSAAGTGTASGTLDLTSVLHLEGEAAGAGQATGDPDIGQVLAGGGAGQGGAAGDPDIATVLAGTATGTGQASGALGAESIGGITLGTVGDTGTIYDGLRLVTGNDFTTVDVVSAGNPNAKFFGCKPYGAARSNQSTLVMWDADPLTTGYLDSNRGNAVGFNTLSIQGGTRLRIHSRRATAPEQAHLAPLGASQRVEVSGAIHTAGELVWYVGSAPIIIEFRARFSPKATNPAGWHPALWTYAANASLNPSDGDEWDIIEGSSQGWSFNYNKHVGGGISGWGYGGMVINQFDLVDRLYSAKFVKGSDVPLYVNGTLHTTSTGQDANSQNKTQWLMFSAHILNSSFFGETYNATAWGASATGAYFEVDYYRVWADPSVPYYVPLATVPSANVDYAGTGSIVLPSKTALWGDSGVTENVQFTVNEEYDPGASLTNNINQFPAGVTYNSTTRTISIDWTATAGYAGRLYGLVTAWNTTTGAICKPARFVLNRGPKIAAPSLNFEAGQTVSVDIYALCDCGSLVANAAGVRTKTISMTGLAGSGLSYNDATGLLTGTALQSSGTAGITVTNSEGQAASINAPYVIHGNELAGAASGVGSATGGINVETGHDDLAGTAAGVGSATGAISNANPGPAYYSWTGGGRFDASDPAGLTLSGSNILTFVNLQTGNGDLTVAGTAGKITKITAGKNGKDIARVVRDITSSATVPRATASASSVISQLFQGSDVAFTALIAHCPTDANTSFAWSASRTVDAANSEIVGLVRRSASASAFRKNPAGVSNEVLFNATSWATNAWKVIGIVHTGTAVTIYENSLTPIIVTAPQDVAAVSAFVMFSLFAASSIGSSQTWATTQGNMDFAEFVAAAGAKPSAEVQAAMTAMATKFGITLS